MTRLHTIDRATDTNTSTSMDGWRRVVHSVFVSSDVTSANNFLPVGEFPKVICDELDNILSAIKDLALEDESDEYGTLRPTPYALDTIVALLTSAPEQMNGPFPYGSVVSYGNGGIRIEWQRGRREVALVVAGSEQGRTYLYYEEGDRYKVVEPVTAHVVAGFMDWLTESYG